MKLPNLLAVPLAAALVAAGCTCGEARFSLHTDMVSGFAISYPSDWSIVPDEELPHGTLVVFRPDAPCGNVSASISVTKTSLAWPATLDEWFEDKQASLSTLREYTPISTEETIVGGFEAIKHVYSAMGTPATTVQTMQLYVLDGMTAWSVICRCAPECYAVYEAVFDAVVNSFTILE